MNELVSHPSSCLPRLPHAVPPRDSGCLSRGAIAQKVGAVLLALMLALTLELGPIAKTREAEAFAPAIPVAVGYGLIAILGVLGVSTVTMNAEDMARCWSAFTSDVDYVLDSCARGVYEFGAGAAAGGVEILENAVEVSASDLENMSNALAEAASSGSLALSDWSAMVGDELNSWYFVLMAFVDWLMAGGYQFNIIEDCSLFDYYGLSYVSQPFSMSKVGNIALLDHINFTVANEPYSGNCALDWWLFWHFRDDSNYCYYDGWYYLPVAKNALLGELYFARMDDYTYSMYMSCELSAYVDISYALDGWPVVRLPNSNGSECEIYSLSFGSYVTSTRVHDEFFSPDLDEPLSTAFWSSSFFDYLINDYGMAFEPYYIESAFTGAFTTCEIPLQLSAADFTLPYPHLSDTILNGSLLYEFQNSLSYMLDWRDQVLTDNPDVLPERKIWEGAADVLNASAMAGAGLAAFGADAVIDAAYIKDRGSIAFPPIPIDSTAGVSNPYSGATTWADVLSTAKVGVATDVWSGDIPTTATSVTVSTGVNAAEADLVTDTVAEVTRPGSGTVVEMPTVEAPAPSSLASALTDLGDSVSGKFPFCVPFWLADGLSVLVSTPQAPKFDWYFYTPVGRYKYTVDLSPYDSVAGIFRVMFNVLFIFAFVRFVKLIWDTRKGATDD